MAELNAKLHCKKDGVIEEITAYSTLEEVDNKGINIKINGYEAYIKYGVAAEESASQLSCKVVGDNTAYKVLKEASKKHKVFLTAYRNDEVTVIQKLQDVSIEEGEVFYLNNENVPNIEGYDFVMAIPNDFVPTEDTDVKVYYIPNTVPDNTKTDWSEVRLGWELDGDLSLADVINTYSATNLDGVFLVEAYEGGPGSSMKCAPKLNTSNATSLSHMFSACTVLESIYPYDTRNVTNMESMFFMSGYNDSFPVLDTRNVTNMGGMFYISSVKSIPPFDTSKVTDAYYMFALSGLEGDCYIDMPSAINLGYMFLACYDLQSITVDNTHNVKNMVGMFENSDKLTYVSQMDTSKVESMVMMFAGCGSLTTIDWEIDMSSCKDCNYMFERCPATGIKLKNVPVNLDLSNIGTTNYTVVNYI